MFNNVYLLKESLSLVEVVYRNSCSQIIYYIQYSLNEYWRSPHKVFITITVFFLKKKKNICLLFFLKIFIKTQLYCVCEYILTIEDNVYFKILERACFSKISTFKEKLDVVYFSLKSRTTRFNCRDKVTIFLLLFFFLFWLSNMTFYHNNNKEQSTNEKKQLFRCFAVIAS